MFYEFDQNNSGGYFVENETICHRLFIEADSEYEAIFKAEELGCYWDGVAKGIDCECCGDRWYFPDQVDVNNIEEYAQSLADKWGWTTPDARIFYKNGRVKEIFSQKEE